MKRTLLLGTVLPAALVIAAAGGAAGYVGTTVNTADRTAPTVVWPKRTKTVDPEYGPDPATDLSKGRTDSALARQLLPVPDGYVLGPDIDGLGNDRVLSAAQSVAFLKQQDRATFGSDEIGDASKVKGLAVRSYASGYGSLVVEVRLVEAKDAATAGSVQPPASGDSAARFGVPGHPGAACSAKPKDPDNPHDLAEAACVATSGDFLVVVLAYGDAPLDRSDLTGLTAKQLDRLVSPGASV